MSHRKWHFNENDQPVYLDTGDVLSPDNEEDRDAWHEQRKPSLKVRIEKTFDHERTARWMLQNMLVRTPGYGLPPIPCLDQAAGRMACAECKRPIWSVGRKAFCSHCEEKRGNKKTGFSIEDTEYDLNHKPSDDDLFA